MTGPTNQLTPPPIATEEDALEILRVWGGTDMPLQSVLSTTWDDPAAWGLLLVDLARHVSKAYTQQGWSEQEALARIKMGFDAEWESPTDTPDVMA